MKTTLHQWSNVLLGRYPGSSFIICFSAYIRRMLPGKFKNDHNSLDLYLIKFLALIYHKNHTLLVQHLRYLWNTHTCVLILLGQFTYLWLGNLFDISSINICSTFLSYSVTKSNMEDFVSKVLVFENPSVKTCKQYNNTGEADLSCTIYRDSTEFDRNPDPTANWIWWEGVGEVSVLENFQISR